MISYDIHNELNIFISFSDEVIPFKFRINLRILQLGI